MIGRRPVPSNCRWLAPSTRQVKELPSVAIAGTPIAAIAAISARFTREVFHSAIAPHAPHAPDAPHAPVHIPSYCGPPPPSGGTQVITWYGSMMSHVLQWTQFDALTCSFLVPSPASTIS